MAATIIEGKKIAAALRADLAREVEELAAAGRRPGLAVILVGNDPASQVYVRNKERACAEVGIASEVFRLPATTPQGELLRLIQELNRRPEIHGILVQLPLPAPLEEEKILQSIDPAKDVDGFHPLNVGKLLLGLPTLPPCTPAGVMELLRRQGIDPKGKHAVVVGRSNIVGKPMAILLLAAHATVTICHSRSVDLGALCRQADILVAAVGKPGLITGEMLKQGAVVIDVGVNRTEKGLVGDVDFPSAVEVAGAITPVPGGVGPMTIAMLLANTVAAARRGAEGGNNEGPYRL